MVLLPSLYLLTAVSSTCSLPFPRPVRCRFLDLFAAVSLTYPLPLQDETAAKGPCSVNSTFAIERKMIAAIANDFKKTPEVRPCWAPKRGH